MVIQIVDKLWRLLHAYNVADMDDPRLPEDIRDRIALLNAAANEEGAAHLPGIGARAAQGYHYIIKQDKEQQ